MVKNGVIFLAVHEKRRADLLKLEFDTWLASAACIHVVLKRIVFIIFSYMLLLYFVIIQREGSDDYYLYKPLIISNIDNIRIKYHITVD